MGLLDRLAPRRPAADPVPPVAPSPDDPVFATKALRQFLAGLTSHPSPVVLDLGPVVGSNVSFFGEQLGCKIFVEDIFADVDRHVREGKSDQLPEFLKGRLQQASGSVDGVLCWDLLDYLDKAAAHVLASELSRVLGADGALLAFFGTSQSPVVRYTKYIVVDEVTLKYRAYPAVRGRQMVFANRDIIRLFPELRVSDSFLLKNNVREIVFKKPA